MALDLINDNLKRLFYKFLIPAIGGALVVAAYSFVDTIAIGQGVGADGTAACAVFLSVFCIADFIGIVCGIGGSVLLSKAKGGGQNEKANAYYSASFLLVALLTVLTWVALLFFQEPLYRLFGADETLLPYVMEYGNTLVLAFPAFVLLAFLPSFLRNDGAPNLVIVASLIGAAINIIGDWLFVFPLQMGMFGAALATVLGCLIQVVIMVSYLFTKRCSLKFVKPYRIATAFRKIVTNGFGTGFSSLAVIAVTFVANNQIMKYADTAALAVYGMIGTVSTLFIHVFSGVGQAAQPIASSGYGAGKPERYWGVYGLGMKNVLCLGVIFAAICMLLPGQITALFIKTTPEVMEIAPFILRTYAISFIPLGISTFLSVYLQSIMRSKPATMIAVMRGIVVNCALLYLLPLVFDAAGIWFAFAAAEIMVAAFALFYMYKTKEKKT